MHFKSFPLNTKTCWPSYLSSLDILLLKSFELFLVGFVLLIILLFVLLCVFTFRVPCSDVRCDFHIKTMFVSSLPPVVCMRVHVLFTLSNTYCVVFLFCFSSLYPMLPVSLYCPVSIAPSVFSNVYLIFLSVDLEHT